MTSNMSLFGSKGLIVAYIVKSRYPKTNYAVIVGSPTPYYFVTK